jgi:hypothetical protein
MITGRADIRNPPDVLQSLKLAGPASEVSRLKVAFVIRDGVRRMIEVGCVEPFWR